MTVTAPSQDAGGAALDAAIAAAQALVTANKKPVVLFQYQQLLNLLQVEAVNHYMVTYWLNAATILAMYTVPTWDKVGLIIAARVTFLQNLVNNAPAMPPGNSEGYGASGWTSIADSYGQMLYAKQMELVQHIMDLPGGTSAATILANMPGSQSLPFEYVFSSVGFTDQATNG